MKRITLLIGMIALMATSSMAQCVGNVNIPDANFKSALLALPGLDANSDLEIQCSEAAAFTGYMNISSSGISDLTGIDAFPLITQMDCINNNLTAMDLSANTLLTYLECSSTSLISLNLTANTALQELYCNYTYSLTSLNVSGLTALTHLECGGNQLASLDFTSNTALQYLNCEDNSLTTLNVSGLTSLTYLDCSGNQLASLDVSSNTALQYLDCYKNQLTSLITVNPTLTELYCDENQLSSLDVSSCTSLIYFYCNANLLTSLTTSGANAIQTFWCNQNKLTALNVSTISALKELDCSYNLLTSLTTANPALTKLMSSNNRLTSLNVSSNSALYEFYCDNNLLTTLNISGITTLHNIDCYNNQLTSMDITSNTGLHELYCYANLLTSLNVSGLANLTYIDCYNNQLSTLDISTTSGLQQIDCSHNNLTSLVSANPALTYLNCSVNNLTGLDVSSNAVLQTFYCINNVLATLNVSGLTSLSDFECDNNQLTALNLTSNTSLNKLYCKNNLLTNLDISGLTSFTNLVCNNNQLTTINVSSNTALGGVNCSNNLLTSLNVKNGNNINFEAFNAIGNAGLSCITVDDVAWSTANWSNIDPGASYSTDCPIPVSWVGGTSNDWSEGVNWSSGSMPEAGIDVVIPAGTTHTPIVNLNSASPAVCKYLTIYPGAALTIASGKALTVSGNLTNNAGLSGLIIQSDASGTGSLKHNTAGVPATIKRYITGSSNLEAMTYHLVSVPLTPATSSTASLFTGAYLYDFDVAGNAWNGLGSSGTTELDETRGYMIYTPESAHTYTFTGPMNAGAFSPLVTFAGDGNNLVPNPYPSAINWDAATGWDKANIANSVYMWPSGGSNYATYVDGTASNGGSNIIPAGQAFIVKATGWSTFSMTDAVRVHSNQAFFKAANALTDLLRIKATFNQHTDEAVIRFTGAATTNADADYDAWKLYGTDGAPQLYTLAADHEMLAINSLPYLAAAYTVPLNFEQEADGNVDLAFSGLESFDPTVSIHLQDLTTNQTINLRQQAVYAFGHTQGENANRFKIIFGGAIGLDETPADANKLWFTGNMLYISAPELSGQAALVEIYNMAGQCMVSQSVILKELTSLNLNMSGPVVARLTTNGTVMTAKGIVIRK